MAKTFKIKDYIVQYYDSRNGMTYKTIIGGTSKENVLNSYGNKSQRKYMKKLKITLKK
jgi:hypothetical protein